jgi:hypothetical protein
MSLSGTLPSREKGRCHQTAARDACKPQAQGQPFGGLYLRSLPCLIGQCHVCSKWTMSHAEYVNDHEPHFVQIALRLAWPRVQSDLPEPNQKRRLISQTSVARCPYCFLRVLTPRVPSRALLSRWCLWTLPILDETNMRRRTRPARALADERTRGERMYYVSDRCENGRCLRNDLS